MLSDSHVRPKCGTPSGGQRLGTLKPAAELQAGGVDALGIGSSLSPFSEALLGVDVGFSTQGNTTGLAWRVNGQVGASVTGSTWEQRRAALPTGVLFDIAALDAPLVPSGEGIPRRGCEDVFYRGAFWNRCRPGLSHHGRGLALRQAGATAAVQFAAVLRPSTLGHMAAVPGASMVEAFPNTFLGVLLPAGTFDALKGAGKERKSDWLFRMASGEGAFDRLLQCLGWSEPEAAERLARERHHDIRAALVCLLSAGFASQGTATVVGDPTGGWFWLPPLALWDPWAARAIEVNVAQAGRRGFAGVAATSPAAMP